MNSSFLPIGDTPVQYFLLNKYHEYIRDIQIWVGSYYRTIGYGNTII